MRSELKNHVLTSRGEDRDGSYGRWPAQPGVEVVNYHQFRIHQQFWVYCSGERASKQLQFVRANFIERMMNNHERVGHLRISSPLYQPKNSLQSRAILNKVD